MTNEISEPPTLSTEAAHPAIYSKTAIAMLSIIFSPIFGGFLLMLNHIAANNKRAAVFAIFVGGLGTAFTFMIMDIFKIDLLRIPLNAVGALFLSEVLFQKHFQAKDYKYKKIWMPLIVSFVIYIVSFTVSSRLFHHNLYYINTK